MLSRHDVIEAAWKLGFHAASIAASAGNARKGYLLRVDFCEIQIRMKREFDFVEIVLKRSPRKKGNYFFGTGRFAPTQHAFSFCVGNA
jgi:hypothetical protein